jgi:putative membrane protein
MRILLVWILNAVALWLVTQIVPGISVSDPTHLLIAVLVLGLVNTLVKPLLILLTLPITLLTLGLFLFVINALLFWFVGSILSGFHVAGFGPALIGAIAYSVLSWALSHLLAGAKA